ncbi:cyclin l1 [Stylonychia lemnae]|uniref:Cyclin l1 n=1 Tax=Stylonychia lemnae TaxID=5949 RepID=A0A078A7D8_STYLE|nr:cyclin l1 [Stylonychia lemnae]|eukprot:CDW77457.1 cyclin l1 [Stylonychia lemnae]
MDIPEIYKTNLEKEFEADQQQELIVQQEEEDQIEHSLLERVQQIPSSQRILTVKNYLDYVCDDFSAEYEDQRKALAINLPINTITPSELDGLSLQDERRFRIYGCELIQDAGILLKLPQVTMATAQAILHRFYYRKSFIKCEIQTVATASLFLAAKIEENARKLKDVVSIFDYVYKMRKLKTRPVPLLDINSFQYTDLKKEIVDAERFILKELGFSTDKISTLNVHKYIYFYLKVLNGSKQLAQKAWNYVNDCYRTIVVVCFPPNVVASSAIYLAAKMMNYPLPQNLEWWKIFGVKFEDIEYVVASILELYEVHTNDTISTLYVEGVIKGIQDAQKAAREQHIKQLKEEGKYEKQTKWAPVAGQKQVESQAKEVLMDEQDDQEEVKAIESKQPSNVRQTESLKEKNGDKRERKSTSRNRRERSRDRQQVRKQDYNRNDRNDRDRDRRRDNHDDYDRRGNRSHGHKKSSHHHTSRRHRRDDSSRSSSYERRHRDKKRREGKSRSKDRKSRRDDRDRKRSRSYRSSRSSSIDSR